MPLIRPGGLLHVSGLPDAPRREYAIRLRPAAPVDPVTATGAVDALVTLLQDQRGGPRWAVTGWATSLVGPWRDHPRVEDDGADGLGELSALIERLDPGPARDRWPGWMAGSTDPGVLALGVAQGRPGRRRLVDIPDGVVGQVTTIDIDHGWARLRHPQPAPDRAPVVLWDSRLGALAALVRHSGGPHRAEVAAVRTLVGWTVGPGRAWCGRWACSRGLPEAHTAAARGALGRLSRLDVDAVLAELLAAAARGAA